MNKLGFYSTVFLFLLAPLAWGKGGSESPKNSLWGPSLNEVLPYGAYPSDDATFPRLFADPLRAKDLPLPLRLQNTSLSEGVRFVAGVNEAIDRQAIQQAWLWAHRFAHNNPGPAHAALDGRLLDFDHFVELPRHAPIDAQTIAQALIPPSLEIWRQSVDPELANLLPSERDLNARFVRTFKNYAGDELLRMAGISGAETSPPAQSLEFILLKVAHRYDMSHVLALLAGGKDLRAAITEVHLRGDIQALYDQVVHIETDRAFRHGITSEQEQQNRARRAKQRTQKIAPANCASSFEAAA